MTGSNSKQILDDIVTIVQILVGLMEAREWYQLEDLALTQPKTFKAVSRAIGLRKEFNGMSLLHACVRFDPPIHILKRMIKLHPNAVMAEDCLGRTPLHVAAGSSANYEVIEILTAQYPEACDIQDVDGKTPLHFACDTSFELFEDENQPARGPPCLATISVLLKASMAAATLEDLDEMNALEYAILSDASLDVVLLLQKASQHFMKKAAFHFPTPTISASRRGAMSRITVALSA
eukprot:CAMPEP_0183751074 /NCGR_PEP_ID=MMETSP0739-20130205/1524_1 /TAXON_ID=385413 /ORGANISM="Thalassiosira miniscula, Strain CCMP1093" /LENGTH=234 /DNA_ID=CAMNT_0025987255 /DNA_START=78 /DNA_END=782 /DNA_ORIENTATION=+